MVPNQENFPDMVHGNTFPGATIGPLTFNLATPPYPLVSCALWFQGQHSGQVAKFSSSGDTDGVINIIDAVHWEVELLPLIWDWNAEIYNWDYKTIDSQGTARTLFAGRMKVVREVTQ